MRLHTQTIFSMLTLLLFSGLFFGSCSEDAKRLEITPTAYGNVDNIFLVCNEYLWTAATGDTFRNHFEALYPITPQPEPIFDIRFIRSDKFNNKVLKTHRAIIIMADLSDKEDPAVAMIKEALGEQKIQRAMSDERYRIAFHNNRWAMGQSVVYWFAPNRAELLESISRDYQQVINIINKLDAEKLSKMVYADGSNLRANEDIKKKFSFELNIPQGFRVAHQDSSILWLYDDSEKVSSNILIHTVENPDPKMMSRDTLIAVRNRLTKKYLASWAEGAYMEVDDENLPLYFQEMLFGEFRALQARGIWRMEKDFMGGSFVSYFIPDPQRNRIILIDGFVYAPGQKKRPEMRKLDTVFSTFKMLNGENANNAAQSK